MEFRTSDGAAHTISSEGLSITFADGFMSAVAGSESLSIPATDLVSMEFTDRAAGVNDVQTTATAVEFYRPDGVSAGTFSSVDAARTILEPGIYIVKFSNGVQAKLYLQK